jgi:plasmid stabilization system protein ParE
MKEIIFSTRARLKLERLLDYLETEWSPKVKHAFMAKLDQALFQIAKMPESCPMSHKKKGVYKCLVSKQTSLFYRINDKGIEVITLFDNRQKPSQLDIK